MKDLGEESETVHLVALVWNSKPFVRKDRDARKKCRDPVVRVAMASLGPE